MLAKPNMVKLFYGTMAFCVLCLLIAIVFNQFLIALLPLATVFGLWSLVDYRVLVILMWTCIPLTTDLHFGTMTIDAPTEPLMLILTGLAILHLIIGVEKVPLKLIRHPLIFLMLAQFIWMLIPLFFANYPLIATKFYVSKIWYVASTFFCTVWICSQKESLHLIVKWSAISITVVGCFILFKHSRVGFSFEAVNAMMFPFFRNHVDYASIAVILLPYFFWKSRLSSDKLLFILATVVCLLMIQFSYTRAAYVTLFTTIMSYFVLKWKLIRPILLISSLFAIVFVWKMVKNNNYLNYAPNYKNTVSHYDFENLMEATSKGEDISTMERVYRWVAGGYMVKENWMQGVGLGNFYETYRAYTVTNFKTYVSDNPEKSGIHCYYLMILVEQGVVGFLLFVLFTFWALVKGENLYHICTDKEDKYLLLAAVSSLVSICLILIINDMLEHIKVGPYFYFALAIIVIFDYKYSPHSKWIR